MDDRTMVSTKGDQGQGLQYLAKQGSLCNLTFDEVHSQLGKIGKPLNTMHLDELLKNVVSVEENQLPQNSSSSSSSSSASLFLGNINLNGTLSKKTVDEIWNEIVHQEHVNAFDNNSTHKQLGETTLEDFLVRAGVINFGNQNCVLNPPPPQPIRAIDPRVVVSPQADWLQLQMAAMQKQQQMTVLDSNFRALEAGYENPVVDVGCLENQLAVSMPMSAHASLESQAAEKKRRYSDEMMKKTIERRQKRMIKNRESAARSRARKQAYTNQLENNVANLRETNIRLKRQKEVEMLLLSSDLITPIHQLRRTRSASF